MPHADLLATIDHTPAIAKAASAASITDGEMFGGYKMIRPLGKGGMGSVYEAEEIESGRRVALKLFGQSLESLDSRQRFLREGRLAASISHPNTVYVYGTEEIDGVPAISMELVAGGTLEAVVRESGPLSVGNAVDAILQVIDGLDAAQKLGVLHRDIKASNCFVDANGAIKVGDFGLSVSTMAKMDLKLTSTGTFLGTPSYASPEQLRGQEIDLRSDIYSVGVTFFFLLTGRIPFEADSFVKLIAAVLEQPTPSVSQLRKEVPRELAAVISRCLEKHPGRRFQSYSELRAALQPFTSDAPIPAGIPLRMLAGIIDSCMLFCCSLTQMAIAGAWFGVNPLDPTFLGSRQQLIMTLVSSIWTIGYFALLEALWGATIGKGLCGLRVVDARRGHPSLFAALIRSTIYYVTPCLPTWLFVGFRPPITNANSFDFFPIVIALALYPMLALLFSTARRRNGYAALQDLASGTRVIQKPETNTRPQGMHAAETAPSNVGAQEKIGPYRILKELDADWRLAHDDKLTRDVWIRITTPDSPAFSQISSNVARSGRLRWLGGKRQPNESWDAFEAASGTSFSEAISRPQSWEVVRFWLADLASELIASEKDGSMPMTLSLDRVWITGDNRAKLLDVPGPRVIGPEKPIESPAALANDVRGRVLLHLVAISALTGKKQDVVTAMSTPRLNAQHFQTLPLHARNLIDGLAQYPPLEATDDALRGVLKKRVHVTRVRRLALFLACVAFPLVSAVFPVAIALYLRQYEASMPSVPKIHAMMERYVENPYIASSRTKISPESRAAIETVIASKYAAEIRDPQFMNTLYTQSIILPWERAAAKRIVAETKPASGEALAKAEAEVAKLTKDSPSTNVIARVNPLLYFFSLLMGSLLMYASIPAVVAAIAFRGGILLAILGLVVVDRNGKPASRLRMAWRSIVAWGTIPLYIMMVLPLVPLIGQGPAAAVCLSLFFGIYLLSVLLPERGIPDRLAGTWLVMR